MALNLVMLTCCYVLVLPALYESKPLVDNVQTCSKSEFITKKVNKDEILTQADHKDLYKRCDTEMLNKCREDPGRNLWVTLAHNAAQNKMLFVVELESITNQDCWGYALQVSSDSSSRTIYFNFDHQTNTKTSDGTSNNNNNNYITSIDISYGKEYLFEAIALPTGKSLKVKTRAPSVCELDVLVQIYDKLQKSTIFKGCTEPGYVKRLRTASQICMRYPDKQQRQLYVRQNLMERNCTFVLNNFKK